MRGVFPRCALVAGAVVRLLFLGFVAAMLGLMTSTAKGAEPVRCDGPSWTLVVNGVLPEHERTLFSEYDGIYTRLARATGHPVGFEIQRVMARVAADYMIGCVRADCSRGPVLFGSSSSFTAVLTDSTRVRSLRMLFLDGQGETNTKVWDTSRGEMVNPCGAQRLVRDRGGCVACVVAFPHRSIGELRRVARLTYNTEGGVR